MTDWKIPLFTPDLTEDDIQAAIAPIHDGWLTMGDRSREFEQVFANRIGARHAFAVCNGTAALHLALAGIEIVAGDEVLVPSLTFVACANVILTLGAKPVFVDVCGEDDWTICPHDMQRKITKRTRALLAVHYAGFTCRMEELLPIARHNDIAVIEDCAHALFTIHNGKTCGTFGEIGCFSFFSNKNMTTGEGGMLVADDPHLAERIHLLRSHGMTTLTLDRHRGHAFSYDVKEFGFNYRIDEIRSALGLSQFRRLNDNLKKRKAIYEFYVEQLKQIEEIRIPFQNRTQDDVGYHIFPILLRDLQLREPLMNTLKEEGIQTSIHYPPIHRFTAYSRFAQEANCPITERITAGEVTLPFYPGMAENDVTTVCEAIKRHLVISRR
jgi:dTDP-4-amino-4,6-dideoxygalactose transaminase